MKKEKKAYRFVEWSSPDELHEASLLWRSELQFVNDEQHFLDDLIKNHTLELISGELYQKSLAAISDLEKEKKQLTQLLEKVGTHINKLEILVDGINQTIEEKQYKQDHYVLNVEVSRYLEDYKETKKDIFNLIKLILRRAKEKRLLE